MKNPFFILIVILIFAGFIRIYNLASIPSSLNWDEASIGYDAWSLLHDGKDQWGERLPFVFKSFGEYKLPFHIYATSLSVAIFGLSDYSVRLPSALMGVVNILLLFILIGYIKKNIYIGLLSSFFMAISPWHIQFSRISWETNFVLFFFLLGLITFLKAKEEGAHKLLTPLSYLLFSFSIYTYNAAKIFVPIFLLVITLIYLKQLINKKIQFFTGIFICILITSFTFLNPKLSGSIRFKQVDFPNDWIISTWSYELSKNRYLSRIELIATQYLSHFSPQFLFLTGDKNPRHSSQFIGQIYFFDGIFILIGLIFLIKRRRKEDLLLLTWFILSPLPASIVKEAPHASRAMFALGSWQIISAIGFYFIYSNIKNKLYSKLVLIYFIISFVFLFGNYFNQYLNNYSIKYSRAWQYGYKQIFVDYEKEFNEYDEILISDEYAQPYIFALYYLKYNPRLFREEVKYNTKENWGFSTVQGFGKYKFGKVENLLKDNKARALLFVTDNEKIVKFTPKNQVKFLDGSIAFWVYEL